MQLSVEAIDAVRIVGPKDVRRAAEELHKIAMAAGLRAAPAHDIADKRTPVDADGNILARDVFGWNDEKAALKANLSGPTPTASTRASPITISPRLI